MVDDCGGTVDFLDPWVGAARVPSPAALAVSPDVSMVTGEQFFELLLLATEDIYVEVGV